MLRTPLAAKAPFSSGDSNHSSSMSAAVIGKTRASSTNSLRPALRKGLAIPKMDRRSAKVASGRSGGVIRIRPRTRSVRPER